MAVLFGRINWSKLYRGFADPTESPGLNELASCQRCGYEDTGKFCSRCGWEIRKNLQSPFGHAVSVVFKIKELREYMYTYLRILRSPTKNTIALYEDIYYHDYLTFLATSMGLYILMVFSRTIAIEENSLVVDLLTSLVFLVTLAVSTSVSFLFFKRSSSMRRTAHEYLKLIALMAGFSTPVAATFQGLQAISVEGGALLALIVVVPLVLYFFRTLQYFWHLSRIKIFLYWMLSSLMGAIAGGVLLALATVIFDVKIPTSYTRVE